MYEKTSKSPAIIFIAGSFFLYVAYSQISSWGKHTPTILKVKAASFFGIASTSDYEKLGDACAAIKNPKCAYEAYSRVYQEIRDPEYISKIAYTYYQVQDYRGAEHTYMLYFRAGGYSPEHAYYYGESLEKLNFKDRALRAYELSLQNRKLKTTKLALAGVKRLGTAGRNYNSNRGLASSRKKSTNRL